MVSFQNGVIYGTGNVLGYDKVGPEYVINEAQAKTVRKIFDMYLAGNGSQKIKKQLEKDGDLTAMGKHQLIVTKEEFERVQRMLEEKNAQTAQWRKNKGVYSDDLWRRKLRCQCGHAFVKTSITHFK